MHPGTFPINNSSDAQMASLRILRKWPVSMATIDRIEKYKKYNISADIQAIFTILVSGHTVLEQYRSNVVMTLRFQGQLIAKIKIQRKKHTLKSGYIEFKYYAEAIHSALTRRVNNSRPLPCLALVP